LHHCAISVEPPRRNEIVRRLDDAGVEHVIHSDVSVYFRVPTAPASSSSPSRSDRCTETKCCNERTGWHTLRREAVAVLLSALRSRRVIDLALAGRPVIVWWQPGTASALSSPTVAGGSDVGATGAFSPVADGRRLHFLAVAGGFRDRETGSHWSVLGHAGAGPLVGENLTPVTHEDTFWFVWAAFCPHTRVVS